MDNNAAFVMVLIIPLLAMNERMWLVHSLREPLANVEVKQMKIDKKIIKRKSGKKKNPDELKCRRGNICHRLCATKATVNVYGRGTTNHPIVDIDK